MPLRMLTKALVGLGVIAALAPSSTGAGRAAAARITLHDAAAMIGGVAIRPVG